MTLNTTSNTTVFPAQQWETASPESQGLSSQAVESVVNHIADMSGEHASDEVMIVRNGYAIHQGPKVDNVHNAWSCTKSFSSTVFGLMWDDEKFSPFTKIAELFPAYAEHYPDVTLEHILTFTSGFMFESRYPWQPLPPRYELGTQFHYTQETDVLTFLSSLASGQSASDIFKSRIADPIGMTDWKWGTLSEYEGTTINGGSGGQEAGMFTNAQTMARFGWLYCNKGKWNGQQLISRRYVDYATMPRVSNLIGRFDPTSFYGDLPGCYGLNWWVRGGMANGETLWSSAPSGTFAAQGNLNNICFIVPAWNMVIIRMGHDEVIPMPQYNAIFDIIREGFSA